MEGHRELELTDTRAPDEWTMEPPPAERGPWESLEPGAVIDDRYEILEEVGRGGMGWVFKVEDLTLHEMVALKVLTVDAAEDPEIVRQFHREVKLARRVAHRNVVRTYDIGTSEGLPFLTMEFLKGHDLRARMRCDQFGLEDAVATASAIADGLGAAHRADVLHRDLKPENVLIGASGRIALTDFGIAGALRAGGGQETIRRRGVGTPDYMAPEQVRGAESMDQRVDIYALGLVVFEMVAGRLPWETDGPMAAAVARIEEPAPSLEAFAPEAPDELVEIVDASLRRDPDERPTDVDHLGQVLERMAVSGGERTVWSPGPAPETSSGSSGSGSMDGTRSSESTGPQTDALRVAVLPIERPSADGTVDELAGGLREDLMYRLGHWERLEIRLRDLPEGTSLASESAAEIGRRLGADAVVRGELDPQEGAYRLRVAVDAVASGDQVWGDVRTFARDEVNDAAEAVADAIGQGLTDSEPETDPDRLPTRAHSLLIRGQQLVQERWRIDIEPALDPLERALELAPEHPRVRSQLAVAHARAAHQNPDERDEYAEQAVCHARCAIDRAGDQWAEPRYALALAHFHDRSYGRAMATLRAALEREPEYAEAHDLLGRIQSELGPLEAAIDHLEEALELNPYLHRAYPDLMKVYALAGRWEDVDEVAERDLESRYHALSRAAIAARLLLWDDRSSLREAVEPHLDELEARETEMLVRVVRTGSFPEEIRRRIEAISGDWPDSRRKIAVGQIGAEMAAHAGDDAAVVTYLDRAIEAGLTDIVWIRHCPLFDDHRDAPEFLRRMGRIEGRGEAVDTPPDMADERTGAQTESIPPV